MIAETVEVALIGEGKNFYVTFNGLKIARRENKAWTILVAGYKVRDIGEQIEVAVEDGTPMHRPPVLPPMRRSRKR